MPKPVVTFSYRQSELKKEDVVLAIPKQHYPADKSNDASSSLRSSKLNASKHGGTVWSTYAEGADSSNRPGTCGVFVVCDGHNGATAAHYIADQLPSYLDELLPSGSPPEASNAKLYKTWRDGVQRALTISLTLLHRAFAGLGVLAGCTVTIVLQHDWLLTTACLGDSRAVLDTGTTVVILTEDHRVATHKPERRRLEKKGSIVAPVDMNGGGPANKKNSVGGGPLRLWPGGLCLSRAVGDFDVGDSVLCLPFISQVLVPENGGRLIIASDGVWDAFDRTSRVINLTRQHTTEAAPQKVLNEILMAHEGVRDDTSLIVVDIMPAGKAFKECCAPRFAAMSGCLCRSGDKAPEEEPQLAEVLTRADIASYAGLMAEPCTAVPPWFTQQLKADLLEAAVQAMAIWGKASGMRRKGRVPSISDFAEETLHVRAVQHVEMDIEEEDNVNPNPSFEDISVRLGTAAHSLIDPAVLRRKPGQLFPEEGSHHSSDANPSVRFGDAVAADREDFGAKFGHYNRELRQVEPSEADLAMRHNHGTTDRAAAPGAPSGATYCQGFSENSHMMRSAFADDSVAQQNTDGNNGQSGGRLSDRDRRGLGAVSENGASSSPGNTSWPQNSHPDSDWSAAEATQRRSRQSQTLTALQKATPTEEESLTRRNRRGTAVKSVAFS